MICSSLVAHRGDQEGNVENTLQAFDSAAKAGARYVECDIQFTKELLPVVIHDDDLSRLCQRRGFVSEHSYQELQQLCFPCFELLSLTRLLHWLQSNPQVTLFMEIKSDALSRVSEENIAAAIHKVVPDGLCARIIIISYSAGILHACSKLLSCSLGWVTDSSLPLPESVAETVSYVFTDVAQADLVSHWQHIGMKVGVYTVNHAAEIQVLIANGIDFVETNYFSSMLSALRGQA